MDAGPGDTRILVADDQPDVIAALRLLLKAEDFEIETAGSPAAVLRAVEGGDFDLILMDLNYTRDTTSGREGLDLLARLRQLDESLPVIVMTAWGSVDGAVEAMRRGAHDYVEKPWENARLIAMLKTQAEIGRTLRRSRRLEDENERLRRGGLPRLISASPAMLSVLEIMERVGPSDANVLVTGEHGTGKEVVSRWLHAASERAAHALVAVNAGGFSEGVFESELFGHVKGAFTEAGPALPLERLTTMEAHLGDALAGSRMAATLMGSFSLVALLLASLGVYATISNSVAARRVEMGVRAALGAPRSRMVGMVMAESLAPVIVGIAVGLVLVFGATPAVEGLLFGVRPTDPLAVGGALLALVGVAVCASWLTARRAARADPVNALRAE